jgi:hypothetical protein
MDFLVRECQSVQWRIISCYISFYSNVIVVSSSNIIGILCVAWNTVVAAETPGLNAV